MAKVRVKQDTTNSFFGYFLYEQVLPQDHFLVRLRHEVDWHRLSQPLLSAYKGGGEYGPPPYAPEKILRMLLIPYLFNISEREAEQVVRFNLLAKYFVGLGVDELPPDHSTLTVFKERLLKHQGKSAWERLFTHTITLAKRKGIKFGRLQIIDSTHTTADVNLDKDKHRQDKWGQPPRDPRASFKTKGGKAATTIKGKKVTVKDTVYGYKTHASFNHHSQIITSLKVTTAKKDDGQQFQTLVKQDLSRGVIHLSPKPAPQTDSLPKPTIYTADKAYDDGDNHTFLETKGLNSAIQLKCNRLNKKDRHKTPWLRLTNQPYYKAATKRRGAIEKKFGEAKKHHGLSRCRYLGLSRYAIQAYLTVMVVNLKRIMAVTPATPLTRYALVPTACGSP